jgi:hypothetical protein
MQFAVPQFIDAEDKIIGALTLKQFGILFGTGLIDVVIFKIFSLGVAFYFIAILLSLAGVVLAFAPFNGRQLYNNIPLVIKFVSQPKVYIFKHVAPSLDSINTKFKISQKDDQKLNDPVLGSTESAQSKLKKLSLLLDQQQQRESDLINRNYYGN